MSRRCPSGGRCPASTLFWNFLQFPLAFFPIFCYNFYIKWNKEAIITEKVTVSLPAYVQRFQCKCGDCRTVCCHGWRINLTEAEHRRLTGLDCSAALRSRMDDGFTLSDTPTADAYAYIHHGADGRCPMLDEAGLCIIHAECGEEVQPAVCRRYPRAVRPGHPAEMVCAGSCEATVELLMDEPTPLPFTEVTGEISGSMPAHEVEHEEDRVLRARCIAILQNSGSPLEKRIGELCTMLGTPISALTDEAQLAAVRALLLAFGRPGNSLSALAAETMSDFALTDGVTEDSIARYRAARTRFAALFPEAGGWYENLLVNHLFFMRFPQRDLSRAEAALAFAETCAILQAVTVCHAGRVGTREAFADAAAAVFRRIEHSSFYELAPQILR